MRNVPRFLVMLLFAALPLRADVEATRATLRQHVVRLINNDRQVYSLPPVQLDAAASAIADEYCRRQIREKTTGHFTVDGYTPYMRYSFAGGNDGVSENAAAWSAPYNFNDRALYEMARRSQDAMMGEQPPNDGHRRTILDPHATHVGVGMAWEGGEFRLVHEFVRRYIDWSLPLPRAARTDESVTASGKPLHGVTVEAVSVHHEPFPRPLTAKAANDIDRYGLPDKRKDYLPRAPNAGLRIGRRTQDELRVTREGAFALRLPFTEGPGVYTIVVWVKKPGESGLVAASNVCIRVDGAETYAGTR